MNVFEIIYEFAGEKKFEIVKAKNVRAAKNKFENKQKFNNIKILSIEPL